MSGYIRNGDGGRVYSVGISVSDIPPGLRKRHIDSLVSDDRFDVISHTGLYKGFFDAKLFVDLNNYRTNGESDWEILEFLIGHRVLTLGVEE